MTGFRPNMPKSAQAKWKQVGSRSNGTPKMVKVREADDEAEHTPVPSVDPTLENVTPEETAQKRCPVCRKMIERGTRNRALCNGLCASLCAKEVNVARQHLPPDEPSGPTEVVSEELTEEQRRRRETKNQAALEKAQRELRAREAEKQHAIEEQRAEQRRKLEEEEQQREAEKRRRREEHNLRKHQPLSAEMLAQLSGCETASPAEETSSTSVSAKSETSSEVEAVILQPTYAERARLQDSSWKAKSALQHGTQPTYAERARLHGTSKAKSALQHGSQPTYAERARLHGTSKAKSALQHGTQPTYAERAQLNLDYEVGLLRDAQDKVQLIPSTPLECPLCTETLDRSEQEFMPCRCGYQLCAFCYSKIISESGQCPACRQHYPDAEATARPSPACSELAHLPAAHLPAMPQVSVSYKVGDEVEALYRQCSRSWRHAVVARVEGSSIRLNFEGYADTVLIPSSQISSRIRSTCMPAVSQHTEPHPAAAASAPCGLQQAPGRDHQQMVEVPLATLLKLQELLQQSNEAIEHSKKCAAKEERFSDAATWKHLQKEIASTEAQLVSACEPQGANGACTDMQGASYRSSMAAKAKSLPIEFYKTGDQVETVGCERDGLWSRATVLGIGDGMLSLMLDGRTVNVPQQAVRAC